MFHKKKYSNLNKIKKIDNIYDITILNLNIYVFNKST